ncbi:hypothetical protein CONPUDRAFT_163394 [Coniophora puteana RWD-64-598 SS2]|uniref:Translocon-associated protein subunit alpha n=1 Tax=Coniophora puteana (strain RWD-64-598) TaxID=741705 RepID=A0A5M3MZH8_CONPW|nr:uncharacterized protein CONPUDRAFT_163394 [Coniophora puteana RWD-64-598 SS2]EIW84214.1 hypothetical protein CONPUDRAFT_163394 [Coniophora puteana RWD-64-598 SS2]
MRPFAIFQSAFALASLLYSVSASPLEVSPPEIEVEAVFPESNPFGHIVNGERNQILLAIENKSDRNVTLQSIAGSFHHPETNGLLRNTTALNYGLRLIEGAKLQLPYTFHSEFKPGDIRLNVWLDVTEDENFRIMAYDSIVTVVEPEASWFDFKLISTYLIVAGLLGGGAYYAYLAYAPQPKKQRKRVNANPSEVSSPVGTVTATGAGGYQEEWIPAHHLKKGKGKKTGALSSGDEFSGAETSGNEGRKRKGRK